MARRENPWYVVLATHDGNLCDTPFFASTRGAAETEVARSQAKDGYGWYADYEVLSVPRPLSKSELTYMITA